MVGDLFAALAIFRPSTCADVAECRAIMRPQPHKLAPVPETLRKNAL